MLVAQSCETLCDPMVWLTCPWYSSDKNLGVANLSLLQGIFSTQRLNLGLLHYWQILYQLSYQGMQSNKDPGQPKIKQ